MILFVIDALIMLGFIFLFDVFADFIFNILFHTWILFYLITGTVAWARLTGVKQADIAAAQEEAEQEARKTEEDAAMEVIAPASDKSDVSGEEDEGGNS